MKLFSLLATSLLACVSLFLLRRKINLGLMRFFRDLSRFKSRRRLYGNQAALMPILLGKEKPIEIDFRISSDGSEDFTVTASELLEMDGRTKDTPIYISLRGLVYDVSAARDKYGPGKSYHALCGKDATISFATGCFGDSCPEKKVEDLNEEELKQVQDWIELYHHHDKYKYIGRLVIDPVDAFVTQEMDETNGKEREAKEEDVDEVDLADIETSVTATVTVTAANNPSLVASADSNDDLKQDHREETPDSNYDSKGFDSLSAASAATSAVNTNNTNTAETNIVVDINTVNININTGTIEGQEGSVVVNVDMDVNVNGVAGADLSTPVSLESSSAAGIESGFVSVEEERH